MNYIVDALVVWAVISLPAGMLIGKCMAKMTDPLPAPLSQAHSASDENQNAANEQIAARIAQHRYDALNNPNYRGGMKI